MEDFAVGKPGQEKGADACQHALKRVRQQAAPGGWRAGWFCKIVSRVQNKPFFGMMIDMIWLIF
jgi:hypothetical protein